MLDRQTEALYYPRPLLQLDQIESVLCVAPHPDDEIFGCGGLLTQLAARACRVDTVILSRGEQSGAEAPLAMAQAREQESRSAAQVLGLKPPRFHDFGDRELVYAEPLIAVIGAFLDEFRPQYLLLPSLSEPHPDHQAVALAGMAAAQRSAHPQTLLFYEVGAPLQPNLFVDISAVTALKWSAIAEFVSQLGIESYDSHARAFASLRAFGLGPHCTAAEAFFRVEAAELRRRGAVAAIPQWPLIRAQHQLANSTQQLPLVSVLIRSIDRPQLTEAIASVAVQTYSHIELVVVNASGRVHGAIPYPELRLSLQLVEPDASADTGCGRSRAANLALRAARGELAIFLDDDDLMAPHHIERLVSSLLAHPMAVGAYAGVRVEGVDAAFQRNYDLPWSRERIRAINFLPIHSLMFRLNKVRGASLNFDETLPVLEDWDFWRKLTGLGDFAHCPGVSAVYRQGHGGSGLGDPEHIHHWKSWHEKLVRRYIDSAGAAEVSQTLAWHAIELDRVQAGQEKLCLALDDSLLQLKDCRRQIEETLRQGQQNLQAKEQQIERFSRESQAALQAKELQIERFSAESQTALRVKEEQLQLAVRNLQNTLSWRITAPLRRLSALLGSSRT